MPSYLAILGDTVWIVCSDRNIYLIDEETRVQKTKIDVSSYGRITSLTLIDGRVWCCTDSGVIVWNYETHEIIKKIEGDHSGKVFGACKVVLIQVVVVE